MSDRKDDFHNNALSDVEKFLLLLSDLKITDSSNSEDLPNRGATISPQTQISNGRPNSTPLISESSSIATKIDIGSSIGENKVDPKVISISKEVDRERSFEPDFELYKKGRAMSSNSFPSLLDELPFLRDIKPIEEVKVEQDIFIQPSIVEFREVRQKEDLVLLANAESLPLTAKDKEEEALNLIQSLFFGSEESQPDLLSLEKESQPDLPPLVIDIATEKSSDDVRALHLLQDILVVPEIEDLRSFKISVEQKLGLVERQVNSPALMNKIKDLENLVQNASLDLSNFGSKLSDIGNEQNNIPNELTNIRGRISQLEHKLYEPNELVQLILPIITEILNLKITESRDAMCQAIMPIIAEVIFERSQQDRVSMGRAISDILPNAISEQIRNSPDEIAKALGPEVGSAIREQIRLDRNAIVDALAPEMGEAIKRQITLERDSMVDALYPVIGNTIAKYFAEAIRTINEKVEQTFSVEGVQRKLRAKLQGVSEAELILRESVPFEVQAVFLIHNLSGLVMIDIQRSDLDSLAEPIDSDMLAGMLTAIRSFANECITRSTSATELDAINYSGSKILIEVAGYCYLAVMIRGEPDRALITKVRDVFGYVVQLYGDQLKQYDGDPSSIPNEAEVELKTLMEFSRTKHLKRSPKTLLLIGLALITLIAVPIGIYQYQSSRDRQLEAKVMEAFASTPELSVYRLNVVANGDRLKLSGKLPNQYLRDRAFQVAKESAKAEVSNDKINNNIFAVNVPPDPELVSAEVQRLTQVLNYTPGVKISSQFRDGQVTVTGQIEQPSLISKITQAYNKISGITSVTNATTVLTPKLLTRIDFAYEVFILQPTDTLKLAEVKAFLDMYPDYKVKIFTKSDNVGNRAFNYQLGMKRCQAVRDALLLKGVSANRLHISGIIEVPIDQATEQTARWVEFEPTLR